MRTKDPNRFYVYILFDPDSGKPFYVGKGCGRRLDSHCWDMRTSNPAKNDIIKSALTRGKDIPRAKVQDSLSEEDAYKLERLLIETLGRLPNGLLTNKALGGCPLPHGAPPNEANLARLKTLNIGRKHKESTKRAISRAHMGKKRAPEDVAKQANSLRGRIMPDDQRAKISAAMKGRPCPPGTRAARIASNKRRAVERRALLGQATLSF